MCVYLFFKCCTDPRQRNLPLTIMAILVQRASHSSILNKKKCSIIITQVIRLCSISNLNKGGAHPLPVGGQNYSSALFGDTEDAVPQKPFGFRVHTSGWLIL